MAEESSDLEKTESPSQRKLEKAREDGHAPQSRELASFAAMAASLACFSMAGAWMVSRMQILVSNSMSFDAQDALAKNAMLDALTSAAGEGLITLSPLLLMIVLAAFASKISVGGWMFSTKGFTPDFSKLDPISGLGRMFSTDSLMELTKAICKAALIGIFSYWAIVTNKDQVLALSSMPIEVGAVQVGNILVNSLWWLTGGLLLIAGIDVPYQLWHYYKQLRMTKEEIKQEARESEGDPQIKARIRSVQREMARRRMMEEVPKADVVITNPTHYSVAIKYNPESTGAPIVVAKGMNHLAQKIREIAKESDVTIMEAPPLARALYKYAEVGSLIPRGLYRAVAEVLAYVYQLRDFRREGGMPPEPPSALEVPAELDPGVSE